MKLSHALVREPSPKFSAFYAARGISISDSLARAQHQAYVAALRQVGLAVSVLPPHPIHHDCVFIEDTAIVWQGRALITNMNDVRNGEQRDVENWLADDFEIAHAPAGAKIEGGDVLHLDKLTLVGRSSRTNDAGIEALAEFMKPLGHLVQAIDVKRCLHLKSGVAYLGNRTLLVAPELIDLSIPGYAQINVPPAESIAANALRINDHVLHAAGFNAVAKLIEKFAAANGLKLIGLEMSELQKADGALTCQSLLW
ncbi:MAG TPA: arginine deiminase family protein [Tepidisphaeraceae bacterium]|nr:arginine deiminase family protein [Tepidisphaeraceae bacterium]